MFTNKDIAQLRKETGAGIMKCKEALKENNGDMQAAKEYLRKKGVDAAAKKSNRIASEGVIGSYVHMGGKIGVLVEVNSETDFVAQNDEFKNLVKDISMHIAASNPKYIRREDIPEDEIAKEKEIFKQEAIDEGKPENIAEKIVEGKMSKYYQQVCLLEQPFVKDDEKTIKQLVEEKTLVIGEKINIRRFTRYEVGEGLEKKQENLAEEVQKQINK